jgi:phenylpropionate dioxygenase-like ring-hydroxylating dioxygenase large terminal subunit
MKGAEFYQPGDLVEDIFGMRGTVAKVNAKQGLVWVHLGNGQMAMRPEELTLLEREGEAVTDLDLHEED